MQTYSRKSKNKKPFQHNGKSLIRYQYTSCILWNNKYFTVQVLEKVCPNSTHTLLERERVWILRFRTLLPLGLNSHVWNVSVYFNHQNSTPNLHKHALHLFFSQNQLPQLNPIHISHFYSVRANVYSKLNSKPNLVQSYLFI